MPETDCSLKKRLGDLHEWLVDQRKGFRRLHLLFGCFGIVECLILIILIFFPHIFGMFGSVESRANVIAALGSVILATGLVFSNLVQRPALRFLGVMVQPDNLDDLADGYWRTLYLVRKGPYGAPEETKDRQVYPNNVKRFPRMVREIRCKTSPTKLKVKDDITNVGYRETIIHEYSIEEYLGEDALGHSVTHADRYPLEYQKRVTLEHRFPREGELKEGFHRLKITAIAATQKLSGTVWLWVSQDKKTILWCSKKGPLEKCVSEDLRKGIK